MMKQAETNHYKAQLAGHYWIMVKVLPGLRPSARGLDVATL